jgi:hypothetical protein
MLPAHNSKKGKALFKRQKYFFKSDANGKSQDGWNQALTTLFPEPAFHDVIEAHGVEGYVDPDWNIRFKITDGTPVVDGPRYSRLQKALWDNFGPTFDDYGVKLINSYTGQAVPIS